MITDEKIKEVAGRVQSIYQEELERNKTEDNPHLQAYRGTKTRVHLLLQEHLGDEFRAKMTGDQGKALWHITDNIVHTMGVMEEKVS